MRGQAPLLFESGRVRPKRAELAQRPHVGKRTAEHRSDEGAGEIRRVVRFRWQERREGNQRGLVGGDACREGGERIAAMYKQ